MNPCERRVGAAHVPNEYSMLRQEQPDTKMRAGRPRLQHGRVNLLSSLFGSHLNVSGTRATTRYALGGAATVLGLLSSWLLYIETRMPLVAFAVFILTVSVVSWFWSLGPGLMAAVFGTVAFGQLLVWSRASLSITWMGVAIETAVLVGMAVVMSQIRRQLRASETRAERTEARMGQTAAEFAQVREQLTELTLELRTLTGVIRLTTATTPTVPGTDTEYLDRMHTMADQLALVSNRLAELARRPVHSGSPT